MVFSGYVALDINCYAIFFPHVTESTFHLFSLRPFYLNAFGFGTFPQASNMS